MRAGFIPALGTPLDAAGAFLEDSYRRQIEDQIQAGAAALLSMGSMGQQAFLRTGECPRVARAAVAAAAGRVPVFVGAMDNSIARVRERIAALEPLDVDGLVFTTPYYHPSSPDQVRNFYRAVAASTGHRVLLYDLAVVTQTKITEDLVLQLLRDCPNLAGIKSADLQMFRNLRRNPAVPDDFLLIYSGLDTFDVASRWGVRHCLDGMLSCTPVNTGAMFRAVEAGDYDEASARLDNIVALRNCFVAHDLWPSYSAAMNLLGYEGAFAPDYVTPASPAAVQAVEAELRRIGEL